MVQLVSSSYLSVAFSTAVFVACTTNNDASVSDAFSTNLFDRVARVTKSNVNNIINRFESPEKIMSQAVLDMQVCKLEM
jgi:3-polyprenyl-4-hydroxybenzoate decarboxylase